MANERDDDLVGEVQQKAHELTSLLDDFGDRLRRMRRRNREVEEEIAAFEQELERMRKRLERDLGD